MNKHTPTEKHFSPKQHLSLLHSLKILLENKDLGDDDKVTVRKFVNNILKKKSDVGTVIVGIQPLLMKAALSEFKKKNYKTAKSTLDLLRMNHHGDSRHSN